MSAYPLRIAAADNDILVGDDGRRYIDLFSAHGAVWLGHAEPTIAAALAAQLSQVWITGALRTPIAEEATALLESFFPDSHRLACLYSTGMEAAELAIRIARVATTKLGVVGFQNSMHGKSLATASLGWDNRDGVHVPFLHRLPFVPGETEAAILKALDAVLATDAVSAVFVEPLQGSGGGHMASADFYRQVRDRCRAHGALLVFDEILTGFHRTGSAFCFSDFGVVPDVVLVGKALGNGFPVSAVLVDRRHAIVPAMLAGSTYAGNALACAAVAATLRRMRKMDLPAMVARIEQTLTAGLAPLATLGVTARGKGALWVLDVPPDVDGERLVVEIYRAGVAVGYAAGHVRLLPAATIGMDNLARGCAVVVRALQEACNAR